MIDRLLPDRPGTRVSPADTDGKVKAGAVIIGAIEDRPGNPWTWCTQRLAELERLVEYRRGGTFDTLPEAYLEVAAWPLLWLRRQHGRPPHRQSLTAWANVFAPALLEKGLEWFDGVQARAACLRRDPYRRADSCAKKLDVTYEERLTLGFFTIGAVDASPEQMKEAAAQRKAAREMQRRRSLGAKPQAASKRRQNCWEWEGRTVSKATFYRLSKAARETVSCQTFPVAETVSWQSSARETISCRLDDVVVFGSARNGLSPYPLAPRAEIRFSQIGECLCGRDGACAVCPPGEGIPLSASATADVELQAKKMPARQGRRQAEPEVEKVAARVELPPQPDDARQLSLLAEAPVSPDLRQACTAWVTGPVPSVVRDAYTAAKRRRAVRQIDIARAIGISRPQLANALAGTFNLSADIIANLKAWLLAPDRTLPPAPFADEDHAARPHHRRGGKRPPDPGPLLPALRLFGAVDGGHQQHEQVPRAADAVLGRAA